MQGFNQQRNSHFSALLNQNVVGATSCRGVHALQADMVFHQGGGQGNRCKTHALSTAKDDQFALQGGPLFKMGAAQVVKTDAVPWYSTTIGHNYHTAAEPVRPYLYPTLAMGCDGLSGHTVWVNFHEMCKDRVNNKLCIWPSELKMQC